MHLKAQAEIWKSIIDEIYGHFPTMLTFLYAILIVLEVVSKFSFFFSIWKRPLNRTDAAADLSFNHCLTRVLFQSTTEPLRVGSSVFPMDSLTRLWVPVFH